MCLLSESAVREVLEMCNGQDGRYQMLAFADCRAQDTGLQECVPSRNGQNDGHQVHASASVPCLRG